MESQYAHDGATEVVRAVIQDSSTTTKRPQKPATQSLDSGIATGTGDNAVHRTGKQPLGATGKVGPIPIPVKGTKPKRWEELSPQRNIITCSQESYEIIPENTGTR